MMTIATTVEEAKQAAKQASLDRIASHGETAYCGFAWVEIKVSRTNSKEAKELIAAGFKRDYKPKTLLLWNPSGLPTQSMDVKEVGAMAFANILQQAGLNAYACSRAD